MPSFTDQTGYRIELHNTPKRIASIVPSQTELLADLELNDEVIAITKFCVHPDNWYRSKERVGGTKNVDLEKLKALNPDLVLANKEENSKEQVDQIRQWTNVWTSDVPDLPAALDMILEVGRLTGREAKANSCVEKTKTAFADLKPAHNPRTGYLIWQNPLMSIGRDSFIHDMMRRCGFLNIFENRLRYPVTSIAEIRSLNPQLLLLPDEPFPFSEKHREAWIMNLPCTKVVLVGGEYFSWYGSRLMQAPSYFRSLIQQIENQV